MEDNKNSKPNKGFIKVRGTATIYEDNAFEFISQKKGKPQRTDEKKYGSAKVYTTTGASPKKVITIECAADAVDPASEVSASFAKVFKEEFKTQAPEAITPKGIVLKNDPTMKMTVNKTKKQIECSFIVPLTPDGKRDYKVMFYEKIQEISKCFAIKETIINKCK